VGIGIHLLNHNCRLATLYFFWEVGRRECGPGCGVAEDTSEAGGRRSESFDCGFECMIKWPEDADS
jgi:hypothetical protein